MAVFLSAFADALGAHPHVLDGALGRALAYVAVALVIGIRLWVDVIGSTRFTASRAYYVVSVICGLTGMLIAINGTAVEIAHPFANPQYDAADIASLDDYYRVFALTDFGHAWLVYSVFLLLAVAGKNRAVMGWLASTGMVLALAAAGHAGEDGWFTLRYGIDVLHLALALVWLGGVAILITGRMSTQWQAEQQDLIGFSRIALPLVTLAALTGIVRLWLQYLNSGLGIAYVMLLGLKLAALGGVVVYAAGLRKRLQTGPDAGQDYDNGLSLEVFFAAIVVFATALLTQLPPN